MPFPSRGRRGLLAVLALPFALIFALTLALCSGAAAASASAPAASAASAETSTAADAAVSFYRWYLRQLVANKDPLHDDAAVMKARVAAALIREIEQKLNSPDGMDADYFIKSQDYLDEWIDSVSASPPSRNAAPGLVTISLGPAGAKAYRLSVKLVRESGQWKIRSVARLR